MKELEAKQASTKKHLKRAKRERKKIKRTKKPKVSFFFYAGLLCSMLTPYAQKRKIVESDLEEEEEATIDYGVPPDTTNKQEEMDYNIPPDTPNKQESHESESSSDMDDTNGSELRGSTPSPPPPPVEDQTEILPEVLIHPSNVLLMNQRMGSLPTEELLPALVELPTSPSAKLPEQMQQLSVTPAASGLQSFFDDAISAGENPDALWKEVTGSDMSLESLEVQKNLLEPFSKDAAIRAAKTSLTWAKVKQEDGRKSVKLTPLLVPKPEPINSRPKVPFEYNVNSKGIIVLDE